MRLRIITLLTFSSLTALKGAEKRVTAHLDERSLRRLKNLQKKKLQDMSILTAYFNMFFSNDPSQRFPYDSAKLRCFPPKKNS